MAHIRSVQIVVTAIAPRDNFETSEHAGEAHTEVLDIVVEDDTTLYRVIMWCKRLLSLAEISKDEVN